MTRHNKMRYQSKPKPKVALTLSGNIYLRHRDDEEIARAGRGDLMVYPYNESLNSTRRGEYGRTGFSGYFKVDVHDGKDWRLVLLNDIFPAREHHFSKSECPIDTYALCEEILRKLGGTALTRTYREHYAPGQEDETSE